MKNAKKVFAMLIVLALAISMAIPVSAAETGKITITNPIEGQTYKAYQMATLLQAGDAYAYYVCEGWEAFFLDETVADIFTYDQETGVVSAPSNADVADIAKLAVSYAKGLNTDTNPENNIPEYVGQKSGNNVEINGLGNGYYCVDTTTGTICNLNTVSNGAASIEEKNSVPTLDKQVDQANTNTDISDAYIGKVLTYTITINVGEGAEAYHVEDIMSKGLTLLKHDQSDRGTAKTGVFEAKVGNDTVDLENIVIATDNTTKVTTIEFDIADVKDYVGQDIVITYYARVNSDAIVGTAITNNAKLTYGDNPNVTPVTDETKTYVYEFNIQKYKNAADIVANKLPGATFSVKKGNEQLSFVAVGAEGSGMYRLAMPGENGTTTLTGSSDTGFFKIMGLSLGEYTIYEESAPVGYNPIIGEAGSIIIGMNNDGSVKYTGYTDGTIDVVNHTGTVLPSTGATGTIIFITVGGLMVVAMGVLLVVRKRMSKVVYTR